jgi:N-acetylmuramoyl-L-alanine amidase
MLPFAYYLLKVIICSAVLFGYYWFFLRNKVFHAYNRFYLLAIVAICILLPIFKINIFHFNDNKTTVIKMLQVVNASDEYMDEIIIGAPNKASVNVVDVLPFVYVLISSVLLIMLIQMLISVVALMKSHEKISIENIQFINTDAAKGTPFSFFKYIFWNKQIDINSQSGNRIFKHEIAHVQERHSWDKMFINLILIVFWSNPFFWLVRRELSMIHEFIADKKAIEDGDTAAFAAMILHATYPQKNFYITNNFFYSPIKRRLMMLTKNQHPRMNYISRLLVLPLLVFIFGAFTIKIAKNINKENAKQILTNKIVVVIDAGHGGSDIGAVNKDGTTEKDIALQLVKKIKELNEDENIQIILSRDNDVYADPKQKAAFAKEQNADLFISVHLDSSPKEEWNFHSGMLVYVAKDGIANTEKSKVLATSIISSFKNNYGISVPPTVAQRQHGIFVLQANSFPSVLIEAGYISNDTDAAYLQSEKGQEAFAKNVLDAITKYAAANLNALINTDNIQQASDSSIYFEGKKVKSYNISVNTKEEKITGVKLLFYDNTSKLISIKEAKENGIEIPTIPNKKSDLVVESVLNVAHSEKKNNSVEVGKASQEDVKLFQKLGHVFTRVETDGEVPYKGANRLVVRDGEIQYSMHPKLFKGDILLMLTGKEAVEKYGTKASDGALEITSKSKYEEPSITKIPFNNSQDTSRKIVFTKVEIEPEFPGGKEAWKNFLQKNIKAMTPADEGWKPGTYKIIVKFIVGANGSLSDFSTENYPDSKTAKHCIAVIKNGPKWIPAKQNGHIVAAYRKQPITFVISDESDKPVKAVTNADPTFKIGELSNTRLKVDDIKKQKFMTVTNGYEFDNATIYFSGTGFSKVGVANLKGNDLSTIEEFLKKCDVGSAITFDNVSVKNKDGIKFIDGKAFILY